MKKEFENQLKPYWEKNEKKEYRDEHDVGSGSWVMVIREVMVEKNVRPVFTGIYWALPHEHSTKNQCCKIMTSEFVVLWPEEYSILSDKRLECHKQNGWVLHQTGKHSNPIIDKKLLDKKKMLSPEDRNIIESMMIDGLSEYQACEEYFLGFFTDESKIGIAYINPHFKNYFD